MESVEKNCMGPPIEFEENDEQELEDTPKSPEETSAEIEDKNSKKKKTAARGSSVSKKRKSKSAEDGETSDKPSSPPSTLQPPSKKSKKDKVLADFLTSQLPALRKEMKVKRASQTGFNIRDYTQYFKPGSDIVPTYCLSLFNFLGKNEVICTQYGAFDGVRHLVKTSDGFNHATLIVSSLGPAEDLSSEESDYIMKKFGKEWFKIPAKDAPRVASAYRYGENHQFKVVLTGIYEDSFFDKETGKEVKTINPILQYEPIFTSKKKEKSK